MMPYIYSRPYVYSFCQIFQALHLFSDLSLKYFGPKVSWVKTALKSVQVKSIHKKSPKHVSKSCPNITQEIASKSPIQQILRENSKAL